MIDLQYWATMASAVTVIFALVKLIVKPFLDGINSNKKVMNELSDTLKELKRDLSDSQKDRNKIHQILVKHEELIYKHNEILGIHTEKINHLYRKD